MKINEMINIYINECYVTLSKNTASGYEKSLIAFKKFILENNIVYSNDLKRHHIMKFLKDLKEAGLVNRTINNYTSTIRRLYDFHNLDVSVFDKMRLREKKKTVNRLSDHELELFLNYIHYLPDVKNNMTYRALFKFMLDSGARIGESIAILKKNVDFENQRIFLNETKNDKERYVVFSSFTYIDLLNEFEKNDSEFLFYNNDKNRPIDYSNDILYFYRKISRELNYTGLTAHRLRHTFASEMLQNGMSLLSLQQLLGHGDIRTTMIYLHADLTTTQKQYNKIAKNNKYQKIIEQNELNS